jgi:beta-lactamase class A
MVPTKFRSVLLAMMICMSSLTAMGQIDSLRANVQRIIASAKGRVGVAVIDLKGNDTLAFNGTQKFPMFSVFKFPIALAVLDRVDKGELSLTQKVYVRKQDLPRNTWSPMRKKYPRGNRNFTVDELLNYTVSLSDNNTTDILLRMLGGPDSVDRYIHALGIRDLAIVANERQLADAESLQYGNWSTPAAMAGLLQMFYTGKVLSPASTEYLWKVMVRTSTGPGRIKGKLPEGTIVAHKTGSSGTIDGVTIATNDVGIVTLPSGKNFAIAAFVAEAPMEEKACEAVIAQVARAVWEYYLMR